MGKNIIDHYRLYRRSNGIYYLENATTRKQQSLRIKRPVKARSLLLAYNQAVEQPALNLALAKAYLSARTSILMTRTWDDVFKEMAASYQGGTQNRFRRFSRSVPVSRLKKIRLAETESTDFLATMNHPQASTSTNKWLRIVHNRTLDLGWLVRPILPRNAWSKIRSLHIKAITEHQHLKLLETENDLEFRHYLEVLWMTGGSQTDIACLRRDNVDVECDRLTYNRKKLLRQNSQGGAAIAIGNALRQLLSQLPQEGFLFPRLALQDDKIRASRFRKRCDRLGFKDVSLHSYRYAWAQRAKTAGMPLREAMAHLGHGSKTIHLAYSEKAEVVTLPLEYYEEVKRLKLVAFQNAASVK